MTDESLTTDASNSDGIVPSLRESGLSDSGLTDGGSHESGLTAADFQRIGVHPQETRNMVIRRAAARATEPIARRYLRHPNLATETQLTQLATSTYRLLDPRQRADASERAHIGRIRPNMLQWAGRTEFASDSPDQLFPRRGGRRTMGEPRFEIRTQGVDGIQDEDDNLERWNSSDVHVASGIHLASDSPMSRSLDSGDLVRDDFRRSPLRRFRFWLQQPTTLLGLITVLVIATGGSLGWMLRVSNKTAQQNERATQVASNKMQGRHQSERRPPENAVDDEGTRSNVAEVTEPDAEPAAQPSDASVPAVPNNPFVYSDQQSEPDGVRPAEMAADWGRSTATATRATQSWLSVRIDDFRQTLMALASSAKDLNAKRRQPVDPGDVAETPWNALEPGEDTDDVAGSPFPVENVAEPDGEPEESSEAKRAQIISAEIELFMGLELAGMSVARHRELALKGLWLCDQLICLEMFEHWRPVRDLARQHCLNTGESQWIADSESLDAAFEKARAMSDSVQPVLGGNDASTASASDASIVGRYLCFCRRDWQLGADWLSRASDKRVASLAAREVELNEQSEPETLFDLAAQWNRLSFRLKGREAESVRLRVVELIDRATLLSENADTNGLPPLSRVKSLELASLRQEVVELLPTYAVDYLLSDGSRGSQFGSGGALEEVEEASATQEPSMMRGWVGTDDPAVSTPASRMAFDYFPGIQIASPQWDQIRERLSVAEDQPLELRLTGVLRLESETAIRLAFANMESEIGIEPFQQIRIDGRVLDLNDQATLSLAAGPHRVSWQLKAKQISRAVFMVLDSATGMPLHIEPDPSVALPSFRGRISLVPSKGAEGNMDGGTNAEEQNKVGPDGVGPAAREDAETP